MEFEATVLYFSPLLSFRVRAQSKAKQSRAEQSRAYRDATRLGLEALRNPNRLVLLVECRVGL